MDDNTQSSGVSNPPNGGQVTDITNPEANDATVSQTAVASQAPPQQSAAQDAAASRGQQPPTPQTPQNAQAPGQPQDQNAPQGKQPDLSKQQNAPQRLSGPVPQNPAVTKASMFHEVAETLAGGPRYKYDTDAYGNTVRQKIPVSNAHLVLAIAMEALTGGITGLANGQGPNGRAKAAAAAMQQSRQNIQQQDQQARQQAQEDFARRAQVTETNMRLYANARNIGRMDAQDTDQYLSQYKPLVEQLQKEYPGMIKGIVKYSDLGKYNATTETAIPYARVQRLDQNGKQITDTRGVPQWDIDYMILDPNFKAQFEPTNEDRKNYKEMTGQDLPEMAGSTAMNASLWMNKKSQLTQWGVAKTNFKDFETTLNEAEENQGGRTTTADLTQPGALTAPAIKNEQVQGLVDSTSQEVAPQVKSVITPDNFQALIHGIVNQESGGDPNAVSKTGATGVMQLTQATANQLGVTDRKDPAQNIKGGTQYFAQLLNQFKDPKLALAAYYSGPGAIQNGRIVDTQLHSAADTNNYAQTIFNNIGAQSVTPIKEGDQFKIPDIGQFSQAHPTFPSAVEKFNASLAHTDGSFGAALKDMESKGFRDDSNLIQAYLGSAQNIKNHDDYVQTQAETRKAEVQTEAQEKRAATKTAQKEAADAATQQRKQALMGTLEAATVPENALNMDAKELIQNLQHQGVELQPEAIRDAQAIARYEAPMSTASNKTWYKDAALNQQDLLNVVRQINPAYREDLYDDLKKFQSPNSPAMKTITASAGVANHLNMLLDAANEAAKGGNGAGQFPALNKLANEFNYQLGKDTYTNIAALTNAVNGEMGKVLSGGFAPDKSEIDALMKNMTPQNSLQQITSLAKLYTGVMHGKVSPLDEEYSQGTGGVRHLVMIPQSTSQLFQRLGYKTPWDAGYKPPVPGAIAGRDANGNIVAWRLPNGQQVPASGQQSSNPPSQEFLQQQQRTADFLNSQK